MKTIMLCCRMPHDNSYVGGVVTIIQNYLSNRDIFLKNGFDLKIFDYEPVRKSRFKSHKINNIIYWIQQRIALSETLKKDSNIVLNIHTSREFLFLKDVMLAKMANKKYGVPVVLTIHVGDISTVFNRISPLQSWLIRTINRYVSKTVFLSKEMRQQFIKAGLDSTKAEVLYNFHYMDQINESEKLQRTSKIHLLYVGAIHKEKGVIELLTALNNIKELDFHLDLCGKLTDKTIEREFNELVKNLDGKVQLHGYVSGKQKTALFERADVLLLPSYHEGMPLVILEALSSGCAIISTSVGGTPEILKKDNVKWINVKSSKDIESAINIFFSNRALLYRMKNINRKYGELYSVNNNIESLCKILDEI